MPAFMSPEERFGTQGEDMAMPLDGKPRPRPTSFGKKWEGSLADSFSAKDIHDSYEPRSPMTAQPIPKHIPPPWQRQMDKVEIDSKKLACWDFCTWEVSTLAH
jgi:hypothetical protein